MLKEEKYIEKRFGKSGGFKVPDGYFDTLSSHVMSRLQEESRQCGNIVCISNHEATRKGFLARHRRTIIGVAASICVIMLPLGAYLHYSKSTPDNNVSAQVHAVEPQSHATSNIDAFMEYSMMDTNDMYSYIADAR